MRRVKMARAVSLILASVLLASSVTGCGGTKDIVSTETINEESKGKVVDDDSKSDETLESVETSEEETTTKAKVKEPDIYEVSHTKLRDIAREFFLIQVQQTVDSRNSLSHSKPTSIGNMVKYNNLNIVADYDEPNFEGLKESYEIINNGLVNADGMVLYDLRVGSISNNFAGYYRYYINSEAVLYLLANLSIESSDPHNSKIKGSEEGYFIMEYKLRRGTTDDWEISKIVSVPKNYTIDMDSTSGWEELQVVNEDAQKIIGNISEDTDLWRQAYIEAIANIQDNNPVYSLIYIDGDDIPELLYEGSSTAAGMCLYSYYNGQITENRLELGGIYYIEKENRIYISDGRMGSYSDVVYKLNQGVLEIQEAGYYWDAYNEKHERIDEYEYTWNDDSVTEEQYDNLVEQAFDKDKATVSAYYSYNSRGEMIDFLNTGDISAPVVSTKKNADVSSNETSIASSEDSNTVSDYQIMHVVNCNESITMRTSPSTKAGEICQIPLGAKISYVEPAGDGFYKIMYNGKVGYVLAAYLEFQ